MKSLTLFYLFETLMRKILKLRKIENQKKEDCDTIPGLIKTFQDRIVGHKVSVRICRSDMEPSHPSSPTRLRWFCWPNMASMTEDSATKKVLNTALIAVWELDSSLSLRSSCCFSFEWLVLDACGQLCLCFSLMISLTTKTWHYLPSTHNTHNINTTQGHTSQQPSSLEKYFIFVPQ